jgi:phage terminase large subunit-like protein
LTTSLLAAPPAALPRVRSVPEYGFSSGDDAIELAASAGLFLDPWQQLAVRDVLAEAPDGKWLTFESALLVPRQNGKGAILEAIEIADMFLFGAQLVIHTAHEFKTAQEAFRRVLFLVENTDALRKRVDRVRTSHGDEGIELKNGARLRFLARSGGSGRGFSCDRLIYDEAYELPEETIAASLPTMSARPNPHVTYASSAALDKSVTLRRVMARGRCEDERLPDPGLAYLEWSADPKCDLDDREEWVRANPATSTGRIRVEFIAKERAAMADVTFGRERLGIVDESKNATVIDLEAWAEAGDPLSSAFDPVCFAVDIGPDASFTSIAMAGASADGRIHVEVVDRRRGTGWVTDRLEELSLRWNPSAIVIDPIGPVGSLLPSFAVAGLDITELGMRDQARACGLFKVLVEEGKLVHKNQPGLTAALESARKRDAGEAGAWLWNRRDETDISPLVAVTLAAFAQSQKAPEVVDSRVIVFR